MVASALLGVWAATEAAETRPARTGMNRRVFMALNVVSKLPSTQPTSSRFVVLCYLNGQYLPRATATIPIEDRGFIFGDGVYEVWRVVKGRLFESERHLARLAHGLRELRLTPPEIA